MWLKRLLGRDETPDETQEAPPPQAATQHDAQTQPAPPAAGLEAGAPAMRQDEVPAPMGTGATSAPSDDVAQAWPQAAGVEVSPPDHAPQGLAAEAGTPEIEPAAESSAPEAMALNDTPPMGMALNDTPPVEMEQPTPGEHTPATAPVTEGIAGLAAPETGADMDLEATARHATEVTADAATHAQEVTAEAVTHAQEITTDAATHATEITATATEATLASAAAAGSDEMATEPAPPLDGEAGDVTAAARPSPLGPEIDAGTTGTEVEAPDAVAGSATQAAPLAASAAEPTPAPQDIEAAPETAAPPETPQAVEAKEIEPAAEAEQATPLMAETGEVAPAVEAEQEAAAVAAPEQEAATEAVPVTGEEPPTPETPRAATPLAPGAVVAERYTIAALLEDTQPGDDTVAMYRANDSRSYEQCWSCGSAGNGPGTRFCQNCGAPIQNHPVTLAQTRAATGLPGEVEQDGAFFHVQPERRRFGAEGIGVEIGAHSAEGPHHPNEDSYWYTMQTLCANSKRQGGAVVVFADGMGGYAPGSGLISSRIAALAGAHIAAALAATEQDGALDAAALDAIMRAGIAESNRMVLDEIARTGEMGATLVIAVIHGDTCYVANVGDSRAYYVDPRGTATQITRDQSLVAQEVAHGHLNEGDIYTAIGNNIILHAIGEADVEQVADIYMRPLEPGSYIVLCSDGYWKTMRGLALPEGLFRDNATLSDAARALVDDALAHDSDDNTTVVLAGIS